VIYLTALSHIKFAVTFIFTVATAVGALVACQGMDHDEVDRRRVELINWYIRKIRGIQALVMAAME